MIWLANRAVKPKFPAFSVLNTEVFGEHQLCTVVCVDVCYPAGSQRQSPEVRNDHL